MQGHHSQDLSRILITSVCGSSYGAQVAKSLSLLKSEYELYGADAIPQTLPDEIMVKKLYAFPRAVSTTYLLHLASIYQENKIDFLIDGSESEQRLLNENREFLNKKNISWITNKKEILDICFDKRRLNGFLQANNFFCPQMYAYADSLAAADVFPVVLKPHSESGGSCHVYIAQNPEDVQAILQLSKVRLEEFCIQQYVGDDQSEYTVGILHNNRGVFIGSITLKRDLTQKLSVKIAVKNLTSHLTLGETLVISSGLSQGTMMHHEVIEEYCRGIAERMGSMGPLNFQGRLVDGKFYIFEINPRCSGTSFMRALSGFNEVDLWIKYLDRRDISIPHYVHNRHCYKRIIKELKD